MKDQELPDYSKYDHTYVKVYPYPNLDNFKTYVVLPRSFATSVFKFMVFENAHYSYERLCSIEKGLNEQVKLLLRYVK